MSGRRDRLTIAAFAAVVVIAGLNFVAVRFSNRELPPFEGAALRFAAAALLFAAYAWARHLAYPRGRALAGALLFGVLGFFAAYALVYWGLVSAPAAMAAVSLALVPLATALLAVAHRLERLRARTLIGGALAAVGIFVLLREQLSATVPLGSLAAMIAGALCAAESGVVVKYFPRSHPAVTNAVAMGAATALLAALSRISGEAWIVPTQPTTLIAFGYLVASTIILFVFILYILGRWTASAASLQFPLAPVVTVIAGSVLAGEGVTLAFGVGAAIVAVGVLVASGVTLPGVRATSRARLA